MKKLLTAIFAAVGLFALVACGGNDNDNEGTSPSGGGQGNALTFQQLRDNETNTTFTMRVSTFDDFVANFGEAYLSWEGHQTMLSDGHRLNVRSYTFLDGAIRVLFAAEDNDNFNVIENGVIRIDIDATPQWVADGRFETYGFGLGFTREEVGELAGFRTHINTLGSDSALRRLTAEGNINAPVATIRPEEYYAMVRLENDVVVSMTVAHGMGD